MAAVEAERAGRPRGDHPGRCRPVLGLGTRVAVHRDRCRAAVARGHPAGHDARRTRLEGTDRGVGGRRNPRAAGRGGDRLRRAAPVAGPDRPDRRRLLRRLARLARRERPYRSDRRAARPARSRAARAGDDGPGRAAGPGRPGRRARRGGHGERRGGLPPPDRPGARRRGRRPLDRHGLDRLPARGPHRMAGAVRPRRPVRRVQPALGAHAAPRVDRAFRRWPRVGDGTRPRTGELPGDRRADRLADPASPPVDAGADRPARAARPRGLDAGRRAPGPARTARLRAAPRASRGHRPALVRRSPPRAGTARPAQARPPHARRVRPGRRPRVPGRAFGLRAAHARVRGRPLRRAGDHASTAVGPEGAPVAAARDVPIG